MAEEKKTITPVAKGVRAKKGTMAKLADVFLAEDITEVKNYIIKDVIIPTVKRAVCDTIVNAANMLIYGTTRSSGVDVLGRNGTPASYVSYSSYSQNQPAKPTPGRYSFDDIVLPTHQEAEDVLRGMSDILASYPVVSVADFYELCGTNGAHTDHNYGWRSIAQAEIIRTKNGYVVKLPKPIPIC